MDYASALTDSLASHLPQGYAWPRHPNSVLMRTVRGIAGSLAELIEFSQATVRQWQPLTTTLRLAEWEAACGLPDVCFGTVQTEDQRRTMVLRTLRGVSLPYNDSSPAAPAVIEGVCLDLGYTTMVRYNTPLRVGRDRTGHRLGKLDGKLYVVAKIEVMRFRVGASRVGARLVQNTNQGASLACYLRRVLPARFEVNVVYQ